MSYLRLVDNKVCEYCGTWAESGLHRHHIRHRAGNHKDRDMDIKENLICLCGECHTKVHAGNIEVWELVARIAGRENKTPSEICEIIGIKLESGLAPKEYIINNDKNMFYGKSLEEALQTYHNCKDAQENLNWIEAEILYNIADLNLSIKDISTQVGRSPAHIRERIKTFKAFPEEHMRAQDLSFTHHRLAAGTEEPEKWINRACEEGFSTRQLKQVIVAECSNKVGTMQDEILGRAEVVVRMAKEIFEYGDQPANWLHEQLSQLLEENKNDNISHVTRIA